MWGTRFWARGLLGVCLFGVLACQGEYHSLAAPDSSPNAAAGMGHDTSNGTAGAGGVGGSGGAAMVDVTGTVVELTTIDFDETAPYTAPITIIAPGIDTNEVQTEAADGSFSLSGAAAGTRWILAKELDGVGGAYSTYSIRVLDGTTPIVVPVVPVDSIQTIASQIDVPSLDGGSAQVVLEIHDTADQPLEGVEVLLPSASVGYAIGPMQYSAIAAGTGALGRAVALNVPVSAPSLVSVTLSVNGSEVTAKVQMAPDTLTYAGVTLDLGP